VRGTQVNPRRSKNGTITLRDVARESGFSPATVSIVLNEAPLAVIFLHTLKSALPRRRGVWDIVPISWRVRYAAAEITLSV